MKNGRGSLANANPNPSAAVQLGPPVWGVLTTLRGLFAGIGGSHDPLTPQNLPVDQEYARVHEDLGLTL